MKLDIDQGNTRLKWRFGQQPMQFGTMEELLRKARTSKLDEVRVVSVVSNSRQQQLISSIVIASTMPIKWSIAQSTAQCGPIKNGYRQPAQLGTDRWCAIVAAATEYQPAQQGLVVVGCGTAYTVDFVDVNKQHLGGWIAPGKIALAQGLRKCTNLHFDYVPGHSDLKLGGNTNECINQGCQVMANGLASQITDMANNLFNDNWMLVLHGGDAEYIEKFMPEYISCYIDSELVLNGLGYVCGEEQQKTRQNG